MKFKSSMNPLLQVLTSLSLSLSLSLSKCVFCTYPTCVFKGFCPDSVYGNCASKLDLVNFGTQ